MLTDKKILGKLDQIERRYSALRFEAVAAIDMTMAETREHFRAEPGEAAGAGASANAGLEWAAAPAGTAWGGDWITGWFRGDVTLPAACDGRKVFVRAETGGETLFLVDCVHRGVFDGNHPVVMMTGRGEAGRAYHVALEAYSGHTIPGCMPNDRPDPQAPKSRIFAGAQVMLEREDVSAFVYDLGALLRLIRALDENSLRRATLIRELARVYAGVDSMPEETDEASWRPRLAQARAIMQPLLASTNGPTMPRFGIVGHSHIDTAWLWPLAETWRKCARTFSSMLNLMEQYPELVFVQSQPCQTAVVREQYPGIFERMQQRVAEGRWEPNGGMWVEPDCNIPSGESFVRQLLIGQQTTREYFGYTSDTLWLPDVFGYSAALPQILRGAGVEFFCTTKIGWNDTTRFPYDTFVWKGIDGSPVIAHFNAIHCWPDPETLAQQWNWVQHKDVQDRRLSAFGYGDGGGGPQVEMVEMARRVRDLEGCPRAEYTTVSAFMRGIRDELGERLPAWQGELYLELHRGTLTSISEIKRGNRMSEIALRDAEFVATLAMLRGAAYPAAELRELWKELLTNQFHDILPGSSIAEVNDLAVQAFQGIVAGARALSTGALQTIGGAEVAPAVSLVAANTLSWERAGEIVLEGVPDGVQPAGEHVVAQTIETPLGGRRLAVAGVKLPALSVGALSLSAIPENGEANYEAAFKVEGDLIETPFARVRFDASGRMVSFVDKAARREIVKAGGALNTLWFGEDIPEAWDNWDVDRDQQLKMRADSRLESRAVVANGPLQLRIRSRYAVGAHSTLVQDVVFHAHTARVDFETVIDWAERHTLLKAGFELDVLADFARHEIQYGHVERPTHANLPQDRARFEVCAHRWTDLSDNGFGVAILNDGKYGVSVAGSDIRLSLLKSGTHPDPRGDAGRHAFTYALLPHAGPFSVEAVVRPAYELNVPLVTVFGAGNGAGSLMTVDAPNVIVESVKWAEQGNAFVARLYEAGKLGAHAGVKFNVPVRRVSETNLLEENGRALELREGAVELFLKPFEIKTLVCEV
jgi:alpha-mannosidase